MLFILKAHALIFKACTYCNKTIFAEGCGDGCRRSDPLMVVQKSMHALKIAILAEGQTGLQKKATSNQAMLPPSLAPHVSLCSPFLPPLVAVASSGYQAGRVGQSVTHQEQARACMHSSKLEGTQLSVDAGIPSFIFPSTTTTLLLLLLVGGWLEEEEQTHGDVCVLELSASILSALTPKAPSLPFLHIPPTHSFLPCLLAALHH